MRIALTLLALVLVLVVPACGGDGGDGGDGGGEGGFALSPSSGSPGTEVSVGEGCDDPPLTAEWTDAAGGSVFSASPSEDSENGITFVPDGLLAGTYTVTVTCGSDAVGEAPFDVTG
ncbi:MAG TPA: hypothetical protein VFR32_07455 [Gaiellaceae bacterium]|nr:hypothetical protein [Gaiellaceae bacterium]